MPHDIEHIGNPEAPYIVRNLILRTLPPHEFHLLRDSLRLVEMKRNGILSDINKPVDAGYFIENGVVSRVAYTSNGEPVEVAVVGRFGFVGVSIALGTMLPLQRCVVQIPGYALRISTDELQSSLAHNATLRNHLLHYVQLLLASKAQVALCNARHEIDQRVVRWMLFARERIDCDELPVTHATLASALGVRRPGVSNALAALEAKNIVRRNRGSLTIVNIDALRQSGCECHKIIHDRFLTFRDMPQFDHALSTKQLFP